MAIHNPQGVDDSKVVTTEIRKMFGRDLEIVSKRELASALLKMRSMMGMLHVELYCLNPKHPYFKKVFAALGAIGISEMERVRFLRMNKIKRFIITLFRRKP